MTREEAIKRLKLTDACDIELCEALDMAIKALEQEPVLNKIRAEIEQEYKVESEHPYGQGLRRALEIIDKYMAEGSDKE